MRAAANAGVPFLAVAAFQAMRADIVKAAPEDLRKDRRRRRVLS
jgi:hypothetical protein